MSDVQATQESAAVALAAVSPAAAAVAAAVAAVPAPPEGAEQFAGQESEPTAPPEHPALSTLAKIEAVAMKWGGDIAIEVRHLLAEVRELL